MEKKDFVSLGLGGTALILSITTTVRTEFRVGEEKARSIRAQLSSVLEKLMELNIENAKLFKDRTDMMYIQNVSSILNAQNSLLLQQAKYLADQVPTLVSPPELNAIGVGYANAGNLPLAEQFYKAAVDRCDNGYDRSMATRSYAAFVFQQRRHEEARELFKSAVKLLPGSDDLARSANGVTYQMWAMAEKSAGFTAEADALFKKSAHEISGIDNEHMKNTFLAALEASKQFSVAAPADPIVAFSTPVVPAQTSNQIPPPVPAIPADPGP